MTNQQFLDRYGELRRVGLLRFDPAPRLTKTEFEMIAVAIAALRVCPRCPRVGERVLVRDLEDAMGEVPWAQSAWREELVTEEYQVRGETTRAVTAAGTSLLRAMYNAVWRWAPGQGPREALS